MKHEGEKGKKFDYFKKDNYTNADLFCDPFYKNHTWAETSDLVFKDHCYFLEYNKIQVFEATTSALVIITTVVFGGITSLVQNCLLP